jgi:hypothetical protein
MASRRKSWKEVGSAVGGVPPTFCCVGDCIRAIRRVAAVMHARRHCLRLPFTAICVQEKRCNVIGMLFFVGNGSCVRKWEVAVVWGKQRRKEFDHKWMTLGSTTVATWSKQVARTVSENSRFRRGLILMVVFGGAQRKRSIPGDYHTIDS